MKGREWERLANREILPVLGESFAVRGSLIYRSPIEHVLLGINAETMYERTRLTLQTVVTPLYRPDDNLAYFVPKTLGGIDVDAGGLPAGAIDLFVDAVPFLEAYATPELLLADSSWKEVDDVVRLEVEGYSYVLTGDDGIARQVLEHASRLELEPPVREWEREIQLRCRHVVSLLEESVGRACAQLAEWEDQTLAALRLPRS
jgi:hypothetical protein